MVQPCEALSRPKRAQHDWRDRYSCDHDEGLEGVDRGAVAQAAAHAQRARANGFCNWFVVAVGLGLSAA